MRCLMPSCSHCSLSCITVEEDGDDVDGVNGRVVLVWVLAAGVALLAERSCSLVRTLNDQKRIMPLVQLVQDQQHQHQHQQQQ
jgi:hypothetical protein